jgi:hypothetical protein
MYLGTSISFKRLLIDITSGLILRVNVRILVGVEDAARSGLAEGIVVIIRVVPGEAGVGVV